MENGITMGSVLLAQATRRGRAEHCGGRLGCPVPQRPRVWTTTCSGGGGPKLLLLYLLPVPSKCIPGGSLVSSALQFSFLCFAILLLYGTNKPVRKRTSCTVHLFFMYRVESNQWSRIQIASVNAFDLRRYAIAQEHGAGTPLTWFNATVAVCPAGISERSSGPDSLPPVCTGPAPLMSFKPIVKPIVRSPL